jgi:hypothetical protein
MTDNELHDKQEYLVDGQVRVLLHHSDGLAMFGGGILVHYSCNICSKRIQSLS